MTSPMKNPMYTGPATQVSERPLVDIVPVAVKHKNHRILFLLCVGGFLMGLLFFAIAVWQDPNHDASWSGINQSHVEPVIQRLGQVGYIMLAAVAVSSAALVVFLICLYLANL